MVYENYINDLEELMNKHFISYAKYCVLVV